MADALESALDSAAELAPAIWRPALKEAARAFLTAAVLLLIVYALTFKHIHPEFVRFMGQDAKPLTATGKDFIPVSVGKGRKEGSHYIIEDFNGDEAILALPRAFLAEDYPFIKVNVEGFTRFSKIKILWRQANNLSVTHALKLERSGDGLAQLTMAFGKENYQGPILDIALLVYDGPARGVDNNNDEDLVIKSVEFRPFSARTLLEQISEDWLNPPLWQHSSINFVSGKHSSGLLFPATVLNLLAGVGIVLHVLNRFVRRTVTGTTQSNAPPVLAVALLICLFSGALHEITRLQWRTSQIADSWERYHTNDKRPAINNDLRCAKMPVDCFESIPM